MEQLWTLTFSNPPPDSVPNLIADHDIRARTFRRAFQDDRVVVAVDPAVGDSDLMATVDVQPVLVSTRGTWQMARPLNVRIDPTVDRHSVDGQIGTS